MEGVYTFQGFSDGMDYWVDAEGENAIWYRPSSSGSSYYWIIGTLANLGSLAAAIYGTHKLENTCPNNEGYVWDWKYGNNGFHETNDVYIKCANEDDFCTSENPCGTDQGDCDTHDECQIGLACGSNNCPVSAPFNSYMDCCFDATNGEEGFCTTLNPCGIDEGNCYADDECQGDSTCDQNNDCPASLGFNSGIKCCIPPCSGSPAYVGDVYCDDNNNNEECQWDGGDCCDPMANMEYCTVCACLDPSA